MDDSQAVRMIRLQERVIELLERIDQSLEHISTQIDLQRETLDGVLVSAMELVDRAKR